MKNIIAFYDDIFQFHYNRLKNTDSTPEVTPLAIISYIQTFHVLLVYIIFYYFFNLAGFLSLYIIGFIICLIVFSVNFYVYIIKNRRDKVLKKNKPLSKKKVMLRQNLVGYGSMLLIAIVIILFNEVF
tara:strand:+ start:205 stop:588 length:384 start_codon:yes stop_codon:yes gene_type:complete